MKSKLQKKPPNWSRLVRVKSQELKGEILEMALGFLLCSAWVNDAIAHAQEMLLRNLLHFLQGNNNMLGLLRVLLPLLFFAAFCFLRKLTAHFAKRGIQVYQFVRERFERKRQRRTLPENKIECPDGGAAE